MAISQNFPEEGPTLNLNFAGSRTLDPRITFTRTQTTSNGSTYMGRDGLIKYAGPDEPRFDHRYVNGEIESLGLLIEESRQNLFTTSEDFTGWGGGGISNTDTILNPYGVLGTVYYITAGEKTKPFNADGYSTLALSFFSKKRFGGLERDYTRIELYQVAVSGGSIGTYQFKFNGNNPDDTYVKDIKTEEYPNGWYRFSCRLVAMPDYNGGVFSTTSRFDIEGGASDNYVWGVQVEPASFATSYIPTEGSTKTRNSDNVSMEGTNFTDWYNPTEGTFNSKVNFYSNNATYYIWQVGVNSSRMLSAGRTGGLSWLLLSIINGVFTDNVSSTYNVGENKWIASYSNDGFFGVANGGSVISSNNDSVPTLDTNILYIGSYRNSGNHLNGHISQLTYYPTRLSNEQLQNLTK